MNAVRLLAHYEKIATAPDAVARLRQFILDLAVRGKLVPQEAEDEPAEQLLEQISMHKATRTGSRLGQSPKQIRPLPAGDHPYEVPSTWVWASFGDVVISRDGERVPVSRAEREQRTKIYDYYGASGVIDKIDSYIFETPLLLIGEDGANLINRSTPIAFIARGKYWVNNHAHVSDGLSEGFLRYLELFINAIDLRPYVTGTAQPKMNQAKMNSIPTAIPPRSEQYRIVAKVDELMALCDQLEAARVEQESARDRLTASTLARLNAPDSDSVREDARFALNALPSLTARSDQIKQLRQTIFSLAVRGKLVPQDPEHGQARRLDDRNPDEVGTPFEIPASWSWCRMSALGKLKGGGTPSKAKDEFWGGDIPWVSPKDMKVDYVSEAQMSITDAAVDGSAVNLIEPGSVLFVVRGMILAHSFPVAISRVALTINQDMKALVLKVPTMAEYVLRALKGLKPQMLARVRRSSHGTCRIEGADYSDFLIPIPPESEQVLIVAKVDELMSICDEIESSLTHTESTRERLLHALLAESLTSSAKSPAQLAA